jgi:hypothetical protein
VGRIRVVARVDDLYRQEVILCEIHRSRVILFIGVSIRKGDGKGCCGAILKDCDSRCVSGTRPSRTSDEETEQDCLLLNTVVQEGCVGIRDCSAGPVAPIAPVGDGSHILRCRQYRVLATCNQSKSLQSIAVSLSTTAKPSGLTVRRDCPSLSYRSG